jgi:hypothetical protein
MASFGMSELPKEPGKSYHASDRVTSRLGEITYSPPGKRYGN